MRTRLFLAALTMALWVPVLTDAPAAAQCILANPSFEVGGSGGQVFGGWNQFGVVASVGVASHGSVAARVIGQDLGSWTLSGYWQSQDCAPGEQWQATGRVQHPSAQALTGACAALVNIEWRDAADNLIDYDSFPVADAGSAMDTWLEFDLLSSPAPAGTVTMRIVLGVLQSPTDPTPSAYFDQATLFSTSAPTIDDVQWNDFPAGTTISFAGYDWRVKGPGIYGPGNNRFCESPDCVWVDAQGRLHMTLQERGGLWYSTEVVPELALGYGDYVLTTEGRLDLLDPEAVLGIFLWQYAQCWDEAYTWWNAFNEIDIEYSRWGNPASAIGQFVAQPYNWPGNIDRFDAVFGAGEVVSHAIRWLPDRVEYRVWRGGPDEEATSSLIHAWTYTGPHIPRPEQPRLHLNLWKLSGTPATDQEVIFRDFTFVPAGGATAVAEEPGSGTPRMAMARLFPAAPNPFNPATTIRYAVDAGVQAELVIHDVAGRRVKTLVSGFVEAGTHEVRWDGRDEDGRRVASGVYLYRLVAGRVVETRRMVLLK